MLSVRERKDQNGVSLEGGHHLVMVIVVVMIVIMTVVVIVMVMMVVVVIVVVVVALVVGVMGYVGGHHTRQADRVMGMVVAVPGLSRGRTGNEGHSTETCSTGNGENDYSFTQH